jgi:hypothetical protein
MLSELAPSAARVHRLLRPATSCVRQALEGSIVVGNYIQSRNRDGQRTSGDKQHNPIVPSSCPGLQSAPSGDTACRAFPSIEDKTARDLPKPSTISFSESIVVFEVSDWQSIADIRRAQRLGLFPGVILSLLLTPVGPWIVFPNSIAGVTLSLLLLSLSRLSVSAVLAATLSILVATRPSVLIRLEVRNYSLTKTIINGMDDAVLIEEQVRRGFRLCLRTIEVTGPPPATIASPISSAGVTWCRTFDTGQPLHVEAPFGDSAKPW